MGRIESERPVNLMTTCYTDRPRRCTTRRKLSTFGGYVT